MLTYATILVASAIVALVARFIYKAISDSSRSAYSSKERMTIIGAPPELTKGKARKAVAGRPAHSGRESRVTPRNLAQTHPAMPTENIDWGWQGSGSANKVSEPATSHCSLYDASAEESSPKSYENSGWLHREDKLEAGGRSYKVTRKTTPKRTKLETESKPRGW